MAHPRLPPAVAVPKKNFADKTTRAFSARIRGKHVKGLVIRWNDRYYAYLNLCRHLPVTLDLEDGRFFNHEGTLLQCHMHGALYEVETGLCVGGPCEGTKLVPLELIEEESRLVITLRDPAAL